MNEIIAKIPVSLLIIVILFLGVLLTIVIVQGRELNLGPIKIGPRNPKPIDDPINIEQEGSSEQLIEGVDRFLNKVIHIEPIRTQTIKLIKDLQNLGTTNNTDFQNAISIDYGEFLGEVRNWTQSKVKIQGVKNDDFLIELYQDATLSVFSTCVVDYLEAWDTPFGKKLLDAHKQNVQCNMTRVFLFRARKEINEGTLEIIKKQREYQVKPFIMIDESGEYYKDFTLIDNGKVLGLTDEIKYGQRITTWYFEDPRQSEIGTYMRNMKSILNHAIHIDDFSLNND